jgi:hypothetical protein
MHSPWHLPQRLRLCLVPPESLELPQAGCAAGRSLPAPTDLCSTVTLAQRGGAVLHCLVVNSDGKWHAHLIGARVPAASKRAGEGQGIGSSEVWLW